MYKFNIEKEEFLSKLYVFLISTIKTFLYATTKDRKHKAGTLWRKVLNAQEWDNCINKIVQEKGNRTFSGKLWLQLNQPRGRSLLFTGLEVRKNIWLSNFSIRMQGCQRDVYNTDEESLQIIHSAFFVSLSVDFRICWAQTADLVLLSVTFY